MELWNTNLKPLCIIICIFKHKWQIAQKLPKWHIKPLQNKSNILNKLQTYLSISNTITWIKIIIKESCVCSLKHNKHFLVVCCNTKNKQKHISWLPVWFFYFSKGVNFLSKHINVSIHSVKPISELEWFQFCTKSVVLCDATLIIEIPYFFILLILWVVMHKTCQK